MLELYNNINSVCAQKVRIALFEKRQDVVEHREPLGGIAIAADDHRGASGALEEELIDVLALLLAHRLQGEVVDEE